MNPRQILVLVALLALPSAFLHAAASKDPTTIESESMDMQGTADKNYFTFVKKVVVKSENLVMNCDRLEIVSQRVGDPSANIGKIGAIESIVAIGNVRIVQSGREARAGHAVMDPRLGVLILTENPSIIDGQTTVMGKEIVLDKNKNVRVKEGKTILNGELPQFNFNRDTPPPVKPTDEWMSGGDALDPKAPKSEKK
ncbi:MAG: LptA/OstA family protein [Verrucomicrobiota bacterium]|nr:LptA/OstA family protein [Verrucomicrobiota bacterium]